MNSQTVLVSNPGIGQKASSLACPSSLLPWVGVSLVEKWGKGQRFSPVGSATIHFQVLMSYQPKLAFFELYVISFNF